MLIELSRLYCCGQVFLRPDTETVLAGIERLFVVLPITAKIALQAYAFPPNYPKDPADRIIGATALIEDFRWLPPTVRFADRTLSQPSGECDSAIDFSQRAWRSQR